MISPEEIKKQVLKWWKPLLQSTISGNSFFPRSINRIGKIRSGDITQNFQILRQEVTALYNHSKSQTGTGYLVKTKERNFRRTGSHDLPDAIVFETVADYVAFINKKREWDLFLLNYEKIIKSIPRLKQWMLSECLTLTDAVIKWEDILKVCHYFLDNPRPRLYLRQLPIAVHTKFIDEHSTLLQSLIDFLIPDDILNPGQKKFAERYFLRYDEPLIRMRVLDRGLACFGNFLDISIPLSDFEKLTLTARNILITENKMNFLTLPVLASAVAVWSGGGFNISYLKDACWLSEANIFYWGDIDEHGFQILHQLRSYYPHARSVMMDYKTFDQFSGFAVVGARNKTERLSLLTDEEHQLFDHLKSSDKNRLEQEKISQKYADAYLQHLVR